jgi:hypothetical protein
MDQCTEAVKEKSYYPYYNEYQCYYIKNPLHLICLIFGMNLFSLVNLTCLTQY